ncbi:hypothetical protein LY78DRAFT_722685 [Colletotrichum sublineola]|uniref:Uncharacterized protein n=1 Tax=Colletotrichum sublineola TaxID=1173701 RepID=A0A066XEX7_COLSU|nr:hypothetical protein LY78DRAFT_722685 [Colletotrichum sublineola]KDN67507.1 hypothetical protein CSUB01_04270 [Colletotrichum sublineola]
MKLTAVANAPFITLLSHVVSVSASSRCLRTGGGSLLHKITMEDVGSENIENVCKSLWDNLKRFPGCMVFRPNGCQEATWKGDLEWYFTTTLACNAGMVHSTFYEATKNRWGAIKCN